MSSLVSRRALLLAAGLTLSLTALPAAAQTKWNLASAYPPANFHTENLVKFAEDVKAATKGGLDITIHSNTSLFKAPEIKRAVMSGSAQAGEVLISLYENEDPLYGVDVVPFLATSYPEAQKLWQAQKPFLEKKFDAQGLKALYAVAWPPQGIFAAKEINKIEDLKGTKWRSYNPGTARIAELVGAQPVTVQAAELPQALAGGIVNALMTSSATGVDSKIWESLKYYYDTQAWLPKNVIIVNKAAFDGLPADQKEAVLKAAADAEKRGWETSMAKTKEYAEKLSANGMKVLPPSPELAAAMKKIGNELTADWLKKAGADGQALVDAYKKL
jgi:TRAP-type C4-dicarboxylate transport system substrate-binding protein